MSIPNTSEKSVDLDRQENLTKGNISAKKVAMYYYDADTDSLKPGIGGDITISGTGLATEDKQDDTIDAIDLVTEAVQENHDLFGSAISGSRYNQVEIDFALNDPDSITDITVTKANGGDATLANGQAVFSTSVATNGRIKAVTKTSVVYRPHAESYVAFTGIFTTGVASSFQRIGIYDANNGFFVGYEGTAYGITIRTSGSDTRIAQASFNVDTLSGGATSKYTRNGVPEAIDPTKDNLYRIRYGWLGASGIYYEVLSPDQTWVTFHVYRTINTGTVPSIANPNLPITLEATKTAGATDIVIKTACWAGGTTSNFQKVTDTLTDNTLATLNRSVITGKTTSGGGGYVNVKVNPSGALVTATTINNGDPTIMYKISDVDAASDPKYNGFLQADGSWYIMKESTSAGTYRYAVGTTGYSTNWTNRASLTYGYFDGAF